MENRIKKVAVLPVLLLFPVLLLPPLFSTVYLPVISQLFAVQLELDYGIHDGLNLTAENGLAVFVDVDEYLNLAEETNETETNATEMNLTGTDNTTGYFVDVEEFLNVTEEAPAGEITESEEVEETTETIEIYKEFIDVDDYLNISEDLTEEEVGSAEREENETTDRNEPGVFVDVDEYLGVTADNIAENETETQIKTNQTQYPVDAGHETQEIEEKPTPFVFLIYPYENYYNDTCAPCSIEFVCSAISDIGLESISLYITDDSEQFFVINKTVVSGKNVSASWNVEMPVGNYSWNCLAADMNENSTWGEKRGIIINSSVQNLTQNITTNHTANETIIVLENVQPVSVLARAEPENEKLNDKEHEKITFFDSFPLAVEVASVSVSDEEGTKEFDEAKNWKIEKTKVKKAEKIKDKIKIKLEDEHVEGIITDGEIEFRKIENGFAVNPITAKETLVFAKAHRTRLFKCKDWDFENEICNGEWEFVQFLTLGEEYVVRIDENDPAFVERGPDIAYDSNGYDVTSNVSSSDDQYAQSSTSTYWVNATFSTGLSQSDAIDYAQVDCEIRRTGAGLTFDLYFDYFNYTDSTWYTVCQSLGLTPPATDSIYTCNASDVAQINKSNQTYRCRMSSVLLGSWYVDMLTLSINAVPMRECGTISDSNAVYYLARNITNDSTCITITGSNVTVDCQGNWIHGDGGTGDFGILINNGQNVTIRNCNISGFQVGIYPFFSTYSTANSPKIYNNILWNNSFGIYSVDGLGGIFENNTIYNNTYGMWGHEIDYASFIGNTFHSNEILCLALNYTWYTNLTNNVFMNSTNGSYYEFQLLNDCRYLRIENTTVLNTSAYFYQAASGGANDFLSLTFGYNRTIGLVNFLKISSANEIRGDNLRSILYPDFVAVNGSIPEFNTTARLILSSPSCPPLILTKPGFPVTKEDVLANGTGYPGAVISCDAESSEVEVYGFSGYTLSSTPPDLDGIIAYRSNTSAYGLFSPKIRFWNSTGNGNWSNEIELQAVGSPIRYAIIKWSPISSKKVLITQSDDGYLDAFVCMENCTNPVSWQYTPDIGRVWTTAPATSSRRFDVEFETVSGDAIVVYGIVDAATNHDLAYKVLPANTPNFTGITEQYIDDTGHATDIQYTWIRMDRNPLQKDELIVVGFDSTDSDINAWVWNGNSWGNQIEISGAATATSGYEALAVRYAADGSKGMAIGGDGTVGNVNTRYWNGAAWSATITFDITSANQDVRWANLKADPASDDLQGIFVDSGSRLGTAYWNGSVWATTLAIDTGLDTGVARCVDFEWDYKGSQGYLVWDTDGAGTTLSYRLCNPQCTGATQTVSTFAGTGAWLTLYRQPDTSKIVRDLGIRLNSNFDIGSFYINSSAPTIYNYGDAAITADTTVSTYEAYSLAFKQDNIPPSIVFTPPTPANDSTITVNYTLINTSITDNIGVAQALLEWNGTNESMNYTNSTNWYKNKTDLAVGTYTYKVWARDYSGNWNVSETRTLSYGSPPIVIVIAPHGEEYDQHSLVSISINATDPDGINYSIAEVTLPNGTMENITLGAGLESDNFDVNTMDTNWFIENVSIGPGQTCNADIDTTIPDKLFISLSGDGSPQTDTLCSVISKKAIDGDFDINISFEILGSLEPDTAFNFQITEMPGSANATKMIFIAVSNWTGFGHLYEIYASDGTFSDYILSRETNDTYGKMRIKRVGNNFTFYTWNNTANDWTEENVSQNEFNLSRAVFVTLEAESVSPGWGSINVSLDNFSVWSNNYTFGLFNNTHTIGLYNVTFYVRDNIGSLNNSEKTNFTIIQVNDPPSTPFILTPSIGSKVYGLYNITWSTVYDEEGNSVWFNITLLNSDYSYNTTLVSNYGNITTTNYEWDTTAHADGYYSLRIVVFENETPEHLSNSYTLPGLFQINNTPPLPPWVIILEPLGGEYADNKPVPIAANITDPDLDGVDPATTYAMVTYPNGTQENITLYKCVGGDSFDTNQSIYNWWVENSTIGAGQTCVADVNGTIPGKAYTAISGDGSPLSDTLCSLVSRRAVYGDFDMNISFEILEEEGVDYAINFELAEISSSANSSQYIFISLSNWTGLGRNYEVFVDDGNISDYIATRETEDTYGKMRIKRVGNNFTFYTWNNTGGEWIEENSTTLNLSNSLFVIMEAESAYQGWGSINASWDNLSIAHDNDTYFSVFDGRVHPLGLYNVSFYASDMRGATNNTEKSNFTVIDINDPPSKPFILTPFPGEIAYGVYHITWSDVVDLDNDTLQFNITLLNPDGSDNTTIIDNYGNASSNKYYWDTTLHANGPYSMRVTVFENETAEHLSNSYTLTGIFYINNDVPVVIINAPHGEEYPQSMPVSISINATDPDGINYSIAEITYPNGTMENLTLEKGQQGDDFSVDSLGINWTDEETTGPSQNCIINIDTTIPDKAFTGISGDGTPESDTLCSLISKKAIDGDFDIQVDFNIEGYEGTDIALNFQVTEIPTSAEASKMAFISLSNWTGLGRNYEVFVDDGNISDYIATRETEDTYGKMRIKRVGNNFTFYTWNNTGGEWIEENSTELDFARAVYITMEAESAYPGWGSINISWDNFVVNDSNFTFGMFENTDLLGLYNVTIMVMDNLGRMNNTEKTNFTIVYHNYPPSKPYLLTPFPGEFVSGTYYITWSGVYDYNNDSLQFNITLLNPDLTYNATIASDYGNSSSTQYDWDSTLYEDGIYSMEILVFENETPEGLSNSYTLTGNFTIDNTRPAVWFEPPTETSGTTIYRNYILVNVSANDTNLNVIGIFLYNSTGGLLNETYSSTSPFFVNFTNLADGLYYFNATAIDAAENQNWTETRNVTILTQGCIGVTKTFRCGEMINESCTMTSNLYSNGTCFTVNESNVQINCSGFSIIGNSSGYGILVQNTTNFSIIDCIIGNFSSSIHILNTNNSLFKNNTLFKSQYGMFMDPSYNNTIIENQIFANSNIGLYLNDSHNNTIRNNTFENNTNAGLKLEYSTNNKIEANIVKNNTVGLYLIKSNLNNISQNNCSLASDCILISDSNYSLISENFVYSNDRTGIRLDPYSVGNNVTDNRVEDTNKKCIYSSGGTLALIKNNTARNCSEDGIFLHNTNNVTVLENTVHESYYGITIYVSNNTNLTDNHVYNNTQDMLVSSDDFNIYNIYIKNLTVDNPSGNFENYTSLDIIDSFGSSTQEEAYIINWTKNSTSLPTDRISFAQKFVEIYPGGGEVSIDSISWTWLDSELTGYFESMFELWKYNSSGWTMLNNTPDTTNNRLSLTNMNPLSVYGILQGPENCPVIASPGTYIQTQNYVGAPNNASPLSGVACVKIAASNVLYDCNGYNITNNGTSGDTYGVLLNGSLLNVTIKNCQSISNYTYGVYVYASNETFILNLTAHNNTQDGIHLRLSSKSIIANSTAYNNSWAGFYLLESENNTIYNNIAYNNPNGGFRIAENSHGNSVFNNTAYKNDNGFWLFTNSTNNLVYNNTAHSNANSGFYVYSSFNNISNNTAYNNSLWGFHIISPYNKIFGNAAYNNTYYGFVLSSSANDTLIFDNVANNNSDDGFWISSSNNIIFNNTAYNQIGSDHCGFRLYGLTARNNKVYNNTAYNNGRGFYLYVNPRNNTFYDNIAYDNSEMGFVLASSSDNTFIHNIAYNNSLTGFYFWQDSNNNYVANNTAYDNKYGFYLWTSYNNTLYNNTAYNNWQHGFNIEFGDTNILINNTLYNNTQSGITLWSTFNNTLSSNIVRNNLKIGMQLNPDSGNNNLTQNYVCFNSIFDINNTNSTNIGEYDKCDSWNNWNESGHEGCTFRCTEVWHYFYGYVNGSLLLAPNQADIFYSWLWNGQKGKVYAINGDASIQWANLTALGRNTTGGNSTNDFTELDTLLGYSAESDNINATYSTDGSNPKETKDMTLHKRFVPYVPQANSTTYNSTFTTGIVWDASQGGPEFSTALNQDVAFVTEINSSATYDYEIRVPANLSTYKGTSGVVKFWIELE